MKIPVWSQAKLGIKLSVIAFVPFLLTSVCIISALVVLSDAYVEARVQQRARQVLQECENALNSLIICASQMSAYTRSRDPQDFAHYRESVDQVRASVVALKQLTQGESPEMTRLVAQLNDDTEMIAARAEEALPKLMKKGAFNFVQIMAFRSDALASFAQEKSTIDAIEHVANSEIAAERPRRSPFYNFIKDNLALAIGFSVLGSISVALLLARSIVERLRMLTDKASRLAMLQAPIMPVQGNDEIAETDRVFNQMSLKLLEAIKREQAAIECAADAILSIDQKGVITAANDALTNKCGWAKDDLIGKNIFEYIPDSAHERMREALEKRASDSFESELRTREGGAMPCLWSTTWSRNESCTIAVVHDVTERKRAEDLVKANEARTRMLMERMPAGLFVLSRIGRIRFANGTAAALCGAAADALIDKDFASLLADSSSVGSAEAFIDLASQQARAFILTLKPRPDLTEENRVQVGITRFSQDNQGDLYLAVMLDYRERWQFEELKQRLVAMIAHDIATPLMTVQNTLTLAGSGMLCEMNDQMGTEVESAEQRSSQILQVFKNIVRFQKLASGFASISASQLPLSVLTQQALDVVAQQVADREIKIDIRATNDASAVGDADKLAVLGATLLQTVVESVPERTIVTVKMDKDFASAHWSLEFASSVELNERALAYFQDWDLLQASSDTQSTDLDLILWRVLLYQCGAHITYRRQLGFWHIDLELPMLHETKPVVAA